MTALEQAHGTLWIGTQSGGLCRFDGSAVACLPMDSVQALLVEPEGAWVATPGALSWVQGDQVTPVLEAGVQALQRHEDQVWAATTRGLFVHEGDQFVQVRPGSCTHLVVLDDALYSRCGRRWATGRGEPTEVFSTDEVVRAAIDADDPGGHWLAAGFDGLVAFKGTQHVTRWLPPEGPVWDLARARDKLALATLDGLVWWTPAGTETWSTPQGLPGQIAALEPGPGDGLWVGTSRGLFLVDPDGPVTPMPLVPVPADAAVLGLWPDARGVGVFHDLGAAWVGKGAPRGFEDLAAAVGPHARHALPGWVLSDRALFQLEKGALHRYELTAPGHLLAAVGDAVVVATDQGLQWWLPGATQLGSPWATEPVRVLAGAGGVGVWVATDGHVALWTPAGVDRSWPIATPALAALRDGVVLARQLEGLSWLDRTAQEPDPILGTDGWGPIVALTVHEGDIIAANDAGELFRLSSPEAPFATADDPDVLELVVQDDHLYVTTLDGLYRFPL